ncbi:tRNA (adenosine(37)-N6)-threonylcarbamoyltransferase complex ATPase subunit type 1 TsaE [Candidatus Kaiserbacteria bacterium CG10_big_fil_rev_8_21_14_0_10_45_20]|uniref:tRNA threonylcarbamoyladenosine biosynthesis protein TsaE n=1 Tax=Candidatus Kaiserbacteria bacterium CG10_big_fil_rev_8_21_14_0_10_45_20 TaxID=1974607 RepID=A0A2H0UFC3_9BACT|nr:MAG: tRNA (adenosine(37)-N6)-threonylcarbamoyltransferase complex ATPase subunit type 1 TsaE [Candidatus Kaiserbacteria bacterium CG10_big_fil_rev_8_21_14_0_10_45_20]
MNISLDQLDTFAKKFVESLSTNTARGAYCVGLSGDLGSGKTTFVQRVAKELGVKEGITSPTFVILQTYPIDHSRFKTLVHIDAYRLSEGESETINFSEYIQNPDNLILIEWPENIVTHAEQCATTLQFDVVDENTREILEKK